MNGAHALINTLVDGGVEVCFANPGPPRCTSSQRWTACRGCAAY
ncbi:putative thiamine pyrophosphate TPP binding domain protein [Mycobacterium xenopi 4042]|uniref:Putative thiamine pyrophosphate TPP binding domain protein n=1 Tax=Mycobacterium xenopi 4042 TaxID=1299334 RepID=X7ZXX5_MYCXE|nr:putative thiamine pyrophosphate TPP binding domain protein [Mycobacterium xenopi 4042]